VAGLTAGRLIDISRAVVDGMTVYDGDPAVRVTIVHAVERGDPATLSLLTLGSHTGTHVDAPVHFFPEAAALDAIPLEVLIGPALVAHVDAEPLVGRTDLERLPLAGHTRLLLRTSNSSRARAAGACSAFRRDYVALDPSGADYLVERGLRLVGIDALSIDAFDAPGHPRG